MVKTELVLALNALADDAIVPSTGAILAGRCVPQVVLVIDLIILTTVESTHRSIGARRTAAVRQADRFLVLESKGQRSQGTATLTRTYRCTAQRWTLLFRAQNRSIPAGAMRTIVRFRPGLAVLDETSVRGSRGEKRVWHRT